MARGPHRGEQQVGGADVVDDPTVVVGSSYDTRTWTERTISAGSRPRPAQCASSTRARSAMNLTVLCGGPGNRRVRAAVADRCAGAAGGGPHDDGGAPGRAGTARAGRAPARSAGPTARHRRTDRCRAPAQGAGRGGAAGGRETVSRAGGEGRFLAPLDDATGRDPDPGAACAAARAVAGRARAGTVPTCGNANGNAGERHSESLVLLSLSPRGTPPVKRHTPSPGGGMADALA